MSMRTSIASWFSVRWCWGWRWPVAVSIFYDGPLWETYPRPISCGGWWHSLRMFHCRRGCWRQRSWSWSTTICWETVGFPILIEHFSMLRNLLRNGLYVVQLFDQVVAINQLLVEVSSTVVIHCPVAIGGQRCGGSPKRHRGRRARRRQGGRRWRGRRCCRMTIILTRHVSE